MKKTPIEEISGIGPRYGATFREHGITDTATLLQECRTPDKRTRLAGLLGISVSHLLTIANRADLMRIPSLGTQFAELLEAAGVDTVAELSRRSAVSLRKKLVEVNNQKHLTRRVPSALKILSWIEKADELPIMLTY